MPKLLKEPPNIRQEREALAIEKNKSAELTRQRLAKMENAEQRMQKLVASETNDLARTNLAKIMKIFEYQETIVVGRSKEKNNVRSNTIYEEYNPVIQKIIIEQIVNKLKKHP